MPSHKFQNKYGQRQKNLKKNLKDDLLKWICEKHATNSPLDRKLLRNKALEISQSLELTNFKCSDQWMTTFLKKYGFSTTLTTCAGPYFKDYRLWIDLMRTVITQYRYRDIFHVDELTMYSDIFPLKVDSNPVVNAEDSQIINATNLISILFCCNASGTDKLPPLICGPYKSSIFREDCRYCYNENSCISDEIFADWMLSLNHIMSQKDRKILLLLHRHRIRALGNTQLSHVKLIFFPADFPPHLRPLRRDVFLSTKMKYRIRYAEKILKPGSKWGLEEMIETVLKSWSEIPRELIVCSFQRTTFRSDNSLLEISCADWDKLNTGISFKNLITFDDHLSDVPNSVSNLADSNIKQIIRGKHNYNLRTSSQEVFPIEESDDISKFKDTLKEQYRLKSEGDLATPSLREEETGANSVENVNLNQEMGLDQEENFENNLHVEENVSKDLENNNEDRVQEEISIFGPGPSGLFTTKNKDPVKSLILVLRERKSPVLGTDNVRAEDLMICSNDENKETIDSLQTREGGVDKQSDQKQLDSSPLMQMGQFGNINVDSNRPTTSSGKRNNSTSKDNEDEPPEKVQRIENGWAKQYETNYVFGPQSGPSTQNVDDESIVEYCHPKDSQSRSKSTKPTGARYIFTVTGTARDPPSSPKD